MSKEDKEAIEGLFTKKTKEADKISDTNTGKEGIVLTKESIDKEFFNSMLDDIEINKAVRNLDKQDAYNVMNDRIKNSC